MPEYDFSEFFDGVQQLDSTIAKGRDNHAYHIARMQRNQSKLDAFDSAEEAKLVAEKADHYEGKSTPFMVQAIGRGLEQTHRGMAHMFYAPFLDEATMQEFIKEDQRIAEGFDQAMTKGGVGAAGKFLANGAKEATDMAGKMTLAAFTGGMPSLYAQYGAQGFSTSYYDARKAGLSKSDAAHHATLMTGTELGLMGGFHVASKAFKFMPDIESKIVGQLSGKVPAASGRRMASRGAAKIVNKSLLRQFGVGAKGLLLEGGVETVEEVTTAIGQSAIRAAQIPGAENEANWVDENGSVMNSPMMKTIIHTARDTAGAMLFINGAPKIKYGVRRFLNSPSRKNARAAADFLVAVGAVGDIKELKDESVRINAQQIVLQKLRDPETALDVLSIAQEYGIQVDGGITTHWESNSGELPPILQGRGMYEVIPGVVLGPRGAETEQAERAIVALHNELGAKHGYKLRVVDVKQDGDASDIEGAHISNDKTIWVTRQHLETLLNDRKGSLKDVAAGVYAHELTHTLELTEGYNEMMLFVHKNFKTEYLKARASYKAAHDAMRKKPGNEHIPELTPEKMNREGLCRWMETGFLKSGMLSKLAKSDMTLFERVRDWFYRRMNSWKSNRRYMEVFTLLQKAAIEAGAKPKPLPTERITSRDTEVNPDDFETRDDRDEQEVAEAEMRAFQSEEDEDPEAAEYRKEWENSERDFESGTSEKKLFEPDEQAREEAKEVASEILGEGTTIGQDLAEVADDSSMKKSTLLDREAPISGKEPLIQVDYMGRLEDPQSVREGLLRAHKAATSGDISEKERERLNREVDRELDDLAHSEDLARSQFARQAWATGDLMQQAKDADREVAQAKGREAQRRADEDREYEEDQELRAKEKLDKEVERGGDQAEQLRKWVAEETERLGGFPADPSPENAVESHTSDSLVGKPVEFDTSPPQALPEPATLTTSQEAGAARDDAYNRLRDQERRGQDSTAEHEEWVRLRDRAEQLEKQEAFDNFTDDAQGLGLSLQVEQDDEASAVVFERIPGDLEDMSRGELQRLAVNRGVPATGSGAQIRTAIKSSRKREVFYDLPTIEDIYYGAVSVEQEARLREFIEAVRENNRGDYAQAAAIRAIEKRLDLIVPFDTIAATPSVSLKMSEAIEVEVPVAAPPTDENVEQVANDILDSLFDDVPLEPEDVDLSQPIKIRIDETPQVPQNVSAALDAVNALGGETKSIWDDLGASQSLAEPEGAVPARGEQLPKLRKTSSGVVFEMKADERGLWLSSYENINPGLPGFTGVNLAGVDFLEKVKSIADKFGVEIRGEAGGFGVTSEEKLNKRYAAMGLEKEGDGWVYRPERKAHSLHGEAMFMSSAAKEEKPKKKKKAAEPAVESDIDRDAIREQLAAEYDEAYESVTEEDIDDYIKENAEVSPAPEPAVEEALDTEAITTDSLGWNPANFQGEGGADLADAVVELQITPEDLRKSGELEKYTGTDPTGPLKNYIERLRGWDKEETLVQKEKTESKKRAHGEILVQTDVGQEAKKEVLEQDAADLQAHVPEGSSTVLEVQADDADLGVQPEVLEKIAEKSRKNTEARQENAARNKRIAELQGKMEDYRKKGASKSADAVADQEELSKLLEEQKLKQHGFGAGTFKGGVSREEFSGENIYEQDIDEWEAQREEMQQRIARIDEASKRYESMPEDLQKVTGFVASHYARLPENLLQAQAEKISRFLGQPVEVTPEGVARATVQAMLTQTPKRDALTGDEILDKDGKPVPKPIPDDLLKYTNYERHREKGTRTVMKSRYEDVAASPERYEDARVITHVPGDMLKLEGEEAGGRRPSQKSRAFEVGDEVSFKANKIGVLKDADNVAVITSMVEVTGEGTAEFSYDIEFRVKGGKQVPAREAHRRVVVGRVEEDVPGFTPARSEQLENIFKDVTRSIRAGSGKYEWHLDEGLIEEAFGDVESANLEFTEKVANNFTAEEWGPNGLGWITGGRNRLTDLKRQAADDGLSEVAVEQFLLDMLDYNIGYERYRGYKKVKKLIAEAKAEELETVSDEEKRRMPASQLSAGDRVRQRIEQDPEAAAAIETMKADMEGMVKALGRKKVGSKAHRKRAKDIDLLREKIENDPLGQLAVRGSGNEHTSLIVEVARLARDVSKEFSFKNPSEPWMRTLVDYEDLRGDLTKLLGDLSRIYGGEEGGDWSNEANELAERVVNGDESALAEIDGYVQIVAESGTVSAQEAAKRIDAATVEELTAQQEIARRELAAEQAGAEDESNYGDIEDEGRVSLNDIAGGLIGEQLVLQSDALEVELGVVQNHARNLSQQIKQAEDSGKEQQRRALIKQLRSDHMMIGSLQKELARKINKVYKIRREISHRVQFRTFGQRPASRNTKVDDFELAVRDPLDRGKWAGMSAEEESFYEGICRDHLQAHTPASWISTEQQADEKWHKLLTTLGAEGAREYVADELSNNATEGSVPGHVNSVLGNQLIEGIYAEAFGDKGNAALQKTAARMTQALLAYGTEVARQLYFLRRLDPIQRVKKALGEAFFMPPERVMKKVRKYKKEENNAAAQKLLDDWTDNKLPKLHEHLENLGWDISNFEDIAADPIKSQQLLDAISQYTASWDDKLFEYWRNSILSGPTTQMANLMGTVFYGAYELGLKRNLQAAANVFANSPHLPTFEENWEILKQMMVTMQTSALQNFRKSWTTEQMVLETKLQEAGLAVGMQREGGVFGAGGKQYIQGKKGKIIRVPQRGLLAVDEFMKTILTEGYAMGYAFRAARQRVAKGDMTEDQSPKFIEYLMQADKKAERVWLPAYQQALRQSWQSEVPKVGQWAIAFRNEYPITRFILPFIVTPMNIMTTGVAMSPFSVFGSLHKMAQLRDDGVDPQTRVEVIEKISDGFTNTVLSGMWMMVLMALTDDDEPWITGSEVDVTRGRQRYATGREGELPPQSVRFPFSDKWFSYARVEPFATATALTIDMIKTMKHGVDGNYEKALQDIAKGLYGQVTEKTFIRGIGELTEALEETFAGRVTQGVGGYASNFAVSFVPNIIRSTARATQESMPERTVSREKGKQIMSLLEVTAKKTEILPALGILKDHPKVDFYGREIPRHKSFGVGGQAGDFMYRVLVPIPVKSTHSFVGDEVMKRYNNRLDDPMDAYIGPERPPRFFKIGGKKKWMSDPQYNEYCQMAGNLAREFTRTLDLNVDNPTERDIEKIREGHKRARNAAKEYCVEKFWGDGAMLPFLEAQTAEDLKNDYISARSRVLARRRPTMKSLSREERGLPYELRTAILKDRVMEYEIERQAAAEELSSEGVGEDEAAAGYGSGRGKSRGRKRIRQGIRTYGE